MKAISTLTLLAVVAAFIAPNSARAGDKEKAIIGGLIGGIIIGAVIADDDFDTHVNVGYHNSSHRGHDHGYWKWVSTKRWVPGYYERSCDRHGRTRKIWISGHYNWVKEKVWVSTHRSSHRGHSYRHSSRHHDSQRGHYDRHSDRRDRDNRHDDRRNSKYDSRDSDHRDNDRHERSSQVVRRF